MGKVLNMSVPLSALPPHTIVAVENEEGLVTVAWVLRQVANGVTAEQLGRVTVVDFRDDSLLKWAVDHIRELAESDEELPDAIRIPLAYKRSVLVDVTKDDVISVSTCGNCDQYFSEPVETCPRCLTDMFMSQAFVAHNFQQQPWGKRKSEKRR